MSLYFLFFVLGAAGMVIMAILGVAGGHGGARANHAHSAAAHSHGHLGHAATHVALAGRGAGRIAGARVSGARGSGARASGARGNRGGRASSGARGGWKSALSNWLSPRVLFTLCLGIGASGLLLAPFLTNEPLRAILSVAGGLGLEKLVVAPLWELLVRFGSAPARTLESAVLEEAVALTAFDSQGCGLVSITLDGHEMRALARLKSSAELAAPHAAPRVRAGDLLLVESVDAARGQCVVPVLL